MVITPHEAHTRSTRDEALRHDERARGKLAPRWQWSEMDTSEHFVQFYETDEFLLDSVSGFIGAGLDAGAACIVIATKAHREGLEERLQATGLDLAAASARGTYLSLDAGETLAMFMVDGLPEPARFAEVVGSLIKRAVKGRRRVPRDAQRADKKEIAGRRRKERPLMRKNYVIFPEGGLFSYDIHPLS